MTAVALRETAGLGFEIQTRLSAVDRYNAWIAQQFLPYAGERVLDVGCAIGNITRHFLDRELVVGIDVAADFVAAISQRFAEFPNFHCEQWNVADVRVRVLAEDRIDTIVCANVLEHVEDDGLALTNMRAILRGGGRLLLLVPAHPFLFGTMDEADEHFRRYTAATLADRVGIAGFQVERLYPMNALGVVAWFVNGKLLRRRLIPSTQYGLYNRLVPALARAERTILRPPVGLSLVCIARTPETEAA